MASKNDIIFEDDDKDFDVIYLDVNLAKNSGKWTEKESIGGFKWTFIVEKILVEGKPKMRTSIRCNHSSSLDNLWMVKANVDIDYPNMKDANYDKKLNLVEYFFNDSVLAVDLMQWDFASQQNSEIIRFDVKLLYKCAPKMGVLPLDVGLKLQFPKNGAEEKEKIIAVNKFVLAGYSNYFRNLFFGNWAESQSAKGKKKCANKEEENSLTIKEENNFDEKAFSLMIYLPMVMGISVEESKILDNFELVLKILKLSLKYDMLIMQRYCEKFLKETDLEGCQKMQLLEVADWLGLKELREHALRSIGPLDISQQFSRNAEIWARLSEKTCEELDKRLERGTKRIREADRRRRMENFKHGRFSFSPNSSRSASPS